MLNTHKLCSDGSSKCFQVTKILFPSILIENHWITFPTVYLFDANWSKDRIVFTISYNYRNQSLIQQKQIEQIYSAHDGVNFFYDSNESSFAKKSKTFS